jgi:thiol-disulfide isomerase/thioredoxin
VNFSLPDTDGNLHSPGDAPLTVVMFTCNHCPYALAWHERLIAVATDYGAKGVKFLAITSNDAVKYPADSPEVNTERVARGDFADVPYLYDESQEVAKEYDAKSTPHVFVLDDKLAVKYSGAPDADYQDPSLNASYLRDALDASLAGKNPDPAQTEPHGCGIKWKDS